MSLSLAPVQSWNLMEIEAPSGTREPMVVHSGNEARAVVIVLTPGQKLGDHQVKENAWITVLEGSASVSAGDDTVEAAPGMLFRFDPDEGFHLNGVHAKIKGVEHWVILGAIVVVGGFVLWMWTRKKSDKPKLADVALEKAAEKAHQRHDAAMASVQPDAPVAPPTTTQVREPQPPV